MKKQFYDTLCGKPMTIHKLVLNGCNNSIALTMHCQFDTLLTIEFLGVSNFRVGPLCYPIDIGGLEIIDNAVLGWENAARYTIRDYEENLIYFHCNQIILHSGMHLQD